MSYLSMSENVGFGSLSQNLSDASCASQYKLAVEGMPGVCTTDNNVYLNDSSGDEHYTHHVSENYLQAKFKIDPNELYTFNESDVVANEITVDHTEENNDCMEIPFDKIKLNFDIPKEDVDLLQCLTNGYVKHETKIEQAGNGHFEPQRNIIVSKELNRKPTSVKKVVNVEQSNKDNISKDTHKEKPVSDSSLSSISSVNVEGKAPLKSSNKSASETFLDVFKREQGLVDGSVQIKIETLDTVPVTPTIVKVVTKKPAPAKPSSSKSKRGRGPAVHEALQRIHNKTLAVPNQTWHAPGVELFDCGPLEHVKPHIYKHLDTSSSEDDDHWPNFGGIMGTVEEQEVHIRGARLALRRDALRRQVVQASTALRLSSDHKRQRVLAAIVKRQLSSSNMSGRLQPNTLAQLLALREMKSVLTSQERRQLRESGWSTGSLQSAASCNITGCTQSALPSTTTCKQHVVLAPNQRLFASCAAVFADGGKCAKPLLPLHAHTLLCPDHAWKRDNYDKLVRDNKPKKMIRKRSWAPPPKKGKRRRRPPSIRETMDNSTSSQSLSEINVCSNSSAYDSSEDPNMGGLSENEFITTTGSSHELVGVEHVPPDDILDPAVLSQIPDEAFTEFFNQAEGGAGFAESSELARALEAVLDERALDTLAECAVPTKMEVHSTIDVETTSDAAS